MDLRSLYTIIAIILAIIIVEFYKRERNRVTANLHTDNLKHLLTLTTLEYRAGHVTITSAVERDAIEKKIAVLVNSYEKGEIASTVFQKKMDSLLDKLK